MLSRNIYAALIATAILLSNPTQVEGQKLDVTSLKGTWKIDVEETKAYLKRVDRAAEATGFEAVAGKVSMTFGDGTVVTKIGEKDEPGYVNMEAEFQSNSLANGTLEINTTDSVTGNAVKMIFVRIDANNIRIEPDNSFPIVITRGKAGVESSEESEMSDADAKKLLVGDWRINMEKTVAWQKEQGMDETELSEMQEDLKQMQVGFGEEGEFRAEIEGREMGGSWTFKSYDAESKTITFEMKTGRLERPSTATILGKSTIRLKPDSDPAIVFDRVVADETSEDDG